MAECLLPLLLVLTALDLAFVHATGAVDSMLLWPMLALTVSAPWLRNLQRRLAYRVLWNGGVLLVFALIVHHATTTGLVHMLEDGLALAVLCQVHLLNNVGSQQRPDLVFFNSLLIAFVTSLFAPDMWWSLLFLLHAFVLVPSLEVHAFTRAGSCLAKGITSTVLRGSLPHACAVVAVTALAFVAMPRDFNRQGWFHELLMQQQFAAGISERIELEHTHTVELSDAVVAQLIPQSGDAGDVPTHWRSIAFSSFDGATWLPQDAGELGSRAVTDLPWDVGRDGAWYRDLPRRDVRQVRVRLQDHLQRRLLTPMSARRVELQRAGGLLLDPRSYGAIGLLRLEDAPPGPIDYVVECTSAAGGVAPGPRIRQHMTALPLGSVPQFVRDLSSQLRRDLPADSDDITIARAMCDWLQQHRRYALPGTPGFANSLGEFLVGTASGHCEYFATALALLLRSSSVPCRIVGGYLAHEWDAADNAIVVRGKDAHAWVEALAADGQWVTLDATPAADVVESSRPAHSWWGEVRADLERMWASITGFDADRQGRWLHRLIAWPGEHASVTACSLAVLLLVLYLRRRRRLLPAIARLHRAARAAGLSLQTGETPRELLLRASTGDPEPAVLATLRNATFAHESERYQKPGTQ